MCLVSHRLCTLLIPTVWSSRRRRGSELARWITWRGYKFGRWGCRVGSYHGGLRGWKLGGGELPGGVGRGGWGGGGRGGGGVVSLRIVIEVDGSERTEGFFRVWDEDSWQCTPPIPATWVGGSMTDCRH